MREVRYYLENNLKYHPHKTNDVLDSVRNRVNIISTPPVKEFLKLELPKKLASDKPVLKGAIDIKGILVTDDHPLLNEAKKYVTSTKPRELFQ